MTKAIDIARALCAGHIPSEEEFTLLIQNRNQETADLLRNEAQKVRHAHYGRSVYIRGLIEIGNICKNDCYYCGIRKSNRLCERYRLTEEDIISCMEEGYPLGFRTFVLQGGEDPHWKDDVLCTLIERMKSLHPDCAITLSLGERSTESYRALRKAGADRYLLRHETADAQHYAKLHPASLSFENRMRCLSDLREAGFQVGCGFMVSSPFQDEACLAKDLSFIAAFQPDMCGVGPFIPHKDTPFADYPAGTLELTCYLLSVIRILCPRVLLPATTALGSIDPIGREKGILSGANVVMPNLSPADVRMKYMLYNNKLSTGAESAQALEELKRRMTDIGYEVTVSRGDVKQN